MILHDSIKNPIQTPVLFLIFNRPDYTKQVFEQIKKARPVRLFIAADGPRQNNIADIQNCARAREIVTQIDWDCDVKLLFRDQNIGCGLGVSSAITWFFDHVEYGIILEDDCVPDVSFFGYAAELLERYKEEPRVMMITGTNCLFNQVKRDQSYFFSRFYPIWGWATWKRAWRLYDFEISSWNATQVSELDDFFKNKTIVTFWKNYFDRIQQKQIDTWDIQWAYACIMQKAFTVVPINNLISNIGYVGVHANGIKSYMHDIPTVSIEKKLTHPLEINIDTALDRQIYIGVRVLRERSIAEIMRDVVRPTYKYFKKIIEKRIGA